MRRFFIDRIKDNIAVLSDASQLHHLRDVLRLKVGDTAIICDALGKEFEGVITKLDKKQAEFKLSPLKKKSVSQTSLTIACAIPKGARLDDVIDSLTQLGVSRIIPMQTDRVVVKLDAAKAKTRHDRWVKIAQSAAQQCQRSVIPAISPITDFTGVIKESKDFDLKLIPHLIGKRTPLKNVIDQKVKNIIVLIGPEGDFTPAEVKLALANGFVPISLGDTILRVAIAAVAVASYIELALT